VYTVFFFAATCFSLSISLYFSLSHPHALSLYVLSSSLSFFHSLSLSLFSSLFHSRTCTLSLHLTLSNILSLSLSLSLPSSLFGRQQDGVSRAWSKSAFDPIFVTASGYTQAWHDHILSPKASNRWHVGISFRN
jgi:hypothetical protein